jgi:tRNA modification GTPase
LSGPGLESPALPAVFSTTDTIVAIATPPGRGGIGVVRLSGPEAVQIAGQLVSHAGEFEPRHATVTRIVQSDEQPIDEAIVTCFPGPSSYTGEHVVELAAHGSPVVLRAIVTRAIASGARLAEPGEFTLRAFLNGRIDLMQAEAVADLVDAVTPLQARAAFDQLQGTLTRAIGQIDARLFDLVASLEASLDFPDEGYRFAEQGRLDAALDEIIAGMQRLLRGAQQGRLIREGLQITIVGKPNVGKSSVFNALVGTARAIVAEAPGTTRDLVTETVEIGGLRATLVDTAGLRPVAEVVEAEGVSRARAARQVSDLTLVVVDRSEPLTESDFDILSQVIDNKRVIVVNKIDKPAAWALGALGPTGVHDRVAEVSATQDIGFDALRRLVAVAMDVEPLSDSPGITNVRHIALVRRAHAAVSRARAALGDGGRALSEEFVLADLQAARTALEEISGRRTTEDLLGHIFSRFCLGK